MKKMKKLFLTSSVDCVIKDIIKYLDKPPSKMSLVFIDTAAEVEEGDKQWLKDDRNSLKEVGFNLFDYTITGKKEDEIRGQLKDVDVIYIEGGNTFYLLEKIKESGLDKIVHEHVNNCKIYIGTSAGSIVAGPDIYPSYCIENVEKAPNLKDYKGLGLVNFVILPHWGSYYFRDLYLDKRLEHAYTEEHKIILLTDYQYVRVQDDWYQIIDVKKEE